MSSTPPYLPLLALRDLVVFPNSVTPLFIGRQQSVRALEMAALYEQKILIATQKDPQKDPSQLSDLYSMGVLATIVQKVPSENGAFKALINSEQQIELIDIFSDQTTLCAHYRPIELTNDLNEIDSLAYKNSLFDAFKDFTELSSKITEEVLSQIQSIHTLPHLVHAIAQHMPSSLALKQGLLQYRTLKSRTEKLMQLIEEEIDVIETEKRIRARIKKQIEKNQREYFLHEQLKIVQKELDELTGNGLSEIDALKQQILAHKMPASVEEKALAEWKKLRSMSTMSAEATVIRNYLDWLLKMPWSTQDRLKKNLKFAQQCLDKYHFGLEDVKSRIVEYLAIHVRSSQLQAPIICFVGPPGIGKTTLARSIAEATGRKFARISLGGVRDETEIRGHRRTYIGALPGRIVQTLTKVGTMNPVILLDEIDKMGNDFRGDPASALLEVLDTEQNTQFNDHYLNVDVDLSKVLFIATANSMNIPTPLKDRMEVITLSSYSEQEKLHIAKEHLLPKLIKEYSIKSHEISLDDASLVHIIRHYTKEAGVRNLSRQLAKLLRKALTAILTKQQQQLHFTPTLLSAYLGAERFSFTQKINQHLIGYVNGLAWTELGGELLGIEVEILPGKGRLTFTGSLGDVMKESMHAAITVARARARGLGLAHDFHEVWDIHVHAPEGAVPKDGPSAGIAITTAIVSALTGIPIQSNIGMTGEVTLRGHVLKIGGLKEKLLAAIRAGLSQVLIPQANLAEIADLPSEIVEQLIITPVNNIDEVLKLSLSQPIDLTTDKYNPLTFERMHNNKEVYQQNVKSH